MSQAIHELPNANMRSADICTLTCMCLQAMDDAVWHSSLVCRVTVPTYVYNIPTHHRWVLSVLVCLAIDTSVKAWKSDKVKSRVGPTLVPSFDFLIGDKIRLRYRIDESNTIPACCMPFYIWDALTGQPLGGIKGAINIDMLPICHIYLCVTCWHCSSCKCPCMHPLRYAYQG